MKPFFFIADYHSITGQYNPDEKRVEILSLATDLLALGMDPKETTLFVQSQVPEHTELCWIFNTLTPVSFLERMTQYKDKSGDQANNVNMGLFDYPVLQAADILIYKGTDVPVGQDQVQHVELTRDIARFFNNKYGVQFFPETKPMLSTFPKLRSLTEPHRKMSKSHGEKSYVALTDTPDQIHDKLKKSPTEATGKPALTEAMVEDRLAKLNGSEPDEDLKGLTGVWNLINLLRIFGREGEAERAASMQPIRYGDLKQLVAARIGEKFEDFRKKREVLARDPGMVHDILAEGAKKARAVAQANIEEVRKIIGLR